ncbi:DUF4279 domain-containing protein [Paenibacillus sp. LjRoot153]|uniref:DUF4279 domain-containing protein n=1 Tax=Paenibacillus sp. LjRoot153 TaxID=3342270 RepID=UPI003ECD2897
MAYFSIFGDSFPVNEVTQLLGIEPSESYSIGDVIVGPKNDNLISSIIHYRKESSWELSSDYQESYDINDQLYYLLDALESKVVELNKIRDEYNVSFKFMVVIKIENNEKPAMYLHHRFISFAYSINADVDFDLYIYS